MSHKRFELQQLTAGCCGAVHITKSAKNSVLVHLNPDAHSALDTKELLFDYLTLTIKIPTLDNKKTFKLHPSGNTSMFSITPTLKTPEELLGYYELEKDGDIFHLYKIKDGTEE